MEFFPEDVSKTLAFPLQAWTSPSAHLLISLPPECHYWLAHWLALLPETYSLPPLFKYYAGITQYSAASALKRLLSLQRRCKKMWPLTNQNHTSYHNKKKRKSTAHQMYLKENCKPQAHLLTDNQNNI
jgi:hypothetical protein